MTENSMTENSEVHVATHYRTASVNGVDIFYREAGPKDAPVLLLLHGFPSSSRMFRDLIPQLSDKYRVIAPDYPGFGHSAVPDRADFAYTFDHLAQIIDQLLDQLGVGSFALYVMDFGAPVGYRLALKYPERLSALVCQNAPLYPEKPEGWWKTLGQYWADGSAEKREACRSYLGLESIRGQYLFGVADPSLIDLLYDIRTNAPAFKKMQEFVRIQRPPTLVATGANDEIFPEPVVRQILTDLPEAEYHALDSGHFALEDKGTQIAGLMRDFLGRVLSA
jgi:pimeloyl-ACP methyl ester carboxylesterase